MTILQNLTREVNAVREVVACGPQLEQSRRNYEFQLAKLQRDIKVNQEILERTEKATVGMKQDVDTAKKNEEELDAAIRELQCKEKQKMVEYDNSQDPAKRYEMINNLKKQIEQASNEAIALGNEVEDLMGDEEKHNKEMQDGDKEMKERQAKIKNLEEELVPLDERVGKFRAKYEGLMAIAASTGPFAVGQSVILLPSRLIHPAGGQTPAPSGRYELFAIGDEYFYFFLADESLEAARANHADAVAFGAPLIATLNEITDAVAAADNPYGLPAGRNFHICKCTVP